MTDTPLFDLAVGFDTPRARRADPITSQRAADKSAETRSQVEAAVLFLLGRGAVLTGKKINRLYEVQQVQRGWPEVAWDTPRKRAGDLARDGLLEIVNPGAPRGTEQEYRVPR